MVGSPVCGQTGFSKSWASIPSLASPPHHLSLQFMRGQNAEKLFILTTMANKMIALTIVIICFYNPYVCAARLHTKTVFGNLKKSSSIHEMYLGN